MIFEDDTDAMIFLEKRGYKHTQAPFPPFHWILPHPKHKPTADENAALYYLFYEWDYGGVIGIDVDEKGRPMKKPRPWQIADTVLVLAIILALLFFAPAIGQAIDVLTGADR